jgi:hypothetical protein
MAIQKEYGQYPEAYWVVVKVVVSKLSQASSARIDVYEDAAAKQRGDSFVHSVIEEWGPENYGEISTGGIPSAYNALKAGLLQGGIDV